MAKTKLQKEELLSQLEDLLSRSKSAVFVNNRGLNAENTVAIRKKLYDEGSKYVVPKKTILKIALRNQKIDPDGLKFTGAVNAIFNIDDEIQGFKTISELTKNTETIEIVGGLFENKLIDKTVVVKLASIPSRQELLGMAVGSLNAPISGFVNVLAGNIRNLVGVINAIKESKA